MEYRRKKPTEWTEVSKGRTGGRRDSSSPACKLARLLLRSPGPWDLGCSPVSSCKAAREQKCRSPVHRAFPIAQ